MAIAGGALEPSPVPRAYRFNPRILDAEGYVYVSLGDYEYRIRPVYALDCKGIEVAYNLGYLSTGGPCFILSPHVPQGHGVLTYSFEYEFADPETDLDVILERSLGRIFPLWDHQFTRYDWIAQDEEFL